MLGSRNTALHIYAREKFCSGLIKIALLESPQVIGNKARCSPRATVAGCVERALRSNNVFEKIGEVLRTKNEGRLLEGLKSSWKRQIGFPV